MGIQAAIDAPRIHNEGNLYEVLMEERIPEDVRQELTRMGHEIVVRPPYSGGFALMQAILVDPMTGLKFAGSDFPRRSASSSHRSKEDARRLRRNPSGDTSKAPSSEYTRC